MQSTTNQFLNNKLSNMFNRCVCDSLVNCSKIWYKTCRHFIINETISWSYSGIVTRRMICCYQYHNDSSFHEPIEAIKIRVLDVCVDSKVTVYCLYLHDKTLQRTNRSNPRINLDYTGLRNVMNDTCIANVKWFHCLLAALQCLSHGATISS